MPKCFKFSWKFCSNKFRISGHMQEKKNISLLLGLFGINPFFVLKLTKIGLKVVCQTQP